MMNIWELYKNSHWVEPFLMGSICLFVGLSAILYLLITESRNRKIKQEKLRNDYEQVIVELMYSVVFMDTPFSLVKEDLNYAPFLKNTYFRTVLAESVINLHKNYDGVYALKLEQFYKDSELINTSFKKLKSHKWEVKCKGITELAEMNITEAFDTIISISKSKNKTLKITAINAAIKLEGIKGIIHLTEHPYPVDDWTQLNIINAFKKHDIGDVQGVEYLLESKNSTVVALGLKLIKELKLTQKLHHVEQLTEKAPNTFIQYEAQSVLQALTVNLANE
ncbi:hypothetical protein [Flavobacterium flavigenum]|uniref:hypothetical protein n=1 Tax=Flavobacterium flavigenum TaxID=3003258 RepID=UPI0022AC114D|nr:hypothetical protein [Flavobacterium flavigenum]